MHQQALITEETPLAQVKLEPTSTPYPGVVRVPLPYEEEAIMTLCRELHTENGIFSLDENKVRALLHKAFSLMGGFLGVIGPPDKLEGMIYLQVTSMWYTDDPCLEELYTFVRPDYRRSKNAVHLLHFSKWCAESSKMPLFIGIISDKQTERKVQLYQRQFGKVQQVFSREKFIAAVAKRFNIDHKQLETLADGCTVERPAAAAGNFFFYNPSGVVSN